MLLMPRPTRTIRTKCRYRHTQWAKQISRMCSAKFGNDLWPTGAITNSTMASHLCSHTLAMVRPKRTTFSCWSRSWRSCQKKIHQLTSTHCRGSSSFWRRIYLKLIASRKSTISPSFTCSCPVIRMNTTVVSVANTMRRSTHVPIVRCRRQPDGHTWWPNTCAIRWASIWWAASICRWIPKWCHCIDRCKVCTSLMRRWEATANPIGKIDLFIKLSISNSNRNRIAKVKRNRSARSTIVYR